MFQIDLKNRTAIYQQVIENFKRMITSGVLKADEQVPSVRELAKILTCNPNTIQKAYRELEAQGYFYTVLGQGSFISAPPNKKGTDARIKALFDKLEELIRELEFLGISKENISKEIKNIIERK